MGDAFLECTALIDDVGRASLAAMRVPTLSSAEHAQVMDGMIAFLKDHDAVVERIEILSRTDPEQGARARELLYARYEAIVDEYRAARATSSPSPWFG
jgi:hypothetical protein